MSSEELLNDLIIDAKNGKAIEEKFDILVRGILATAHRSSVIDDYLLYDDRTIDTFIKAVAPNEYEARSNELKKADIVITHTI